MNHGREIVMVWVTKYALTKGIEKVEVAVSDEYAYSTDRYHTQYPPGRWHRTEAAAVARAEEMRIAKIASLERQIGKLRKLEFAATSGGKASK